MIAELETAYRPVGGDDFPRWQANMRTLTAAGVWLFAPDLPLLPAVTNDLPAEPQPATVSGTNTSRLDDNV